MSSLSIPEIFKYEWRIEKFISKYSKQEKFKLNNGRYSTFVVSKDILAALKKRNRTLLNRHNLVTIEGKIYKWTDLKKTEEFGGDARRQDKPVVNPYYKEDQALYGLKHQIDNLKTKLGSATIPIKIGPNIYDVYDVLKPTKSVKSDFHFIDIKGKETCWISHKDGRYPSDFQQWGGISKSREPKIASSKEVKDFVDIIKNMYPNGLEPKTHIIKKIRSNKLKNQAIFGSDFGMMFGPNNVNASVQGEIRLKSQGKYYTLVANHIILNGKAPTSGGYEPVLTATYKSDRGNNDVPKSRFGIFPAESQKPSFIIE